MDDSDGEPDDWPAAHHARELDDSLRCGVCKSLLRTPMRAGCPHVCACCSAANGSVVCALSSDALAPQFAPSAYAAGWAQARRAARLVGRRVPGLQALTAAFRPDSRRLAAQAMDPAQLRPDATLHTIVCAFRAARPQLLAAVNAVAARSQAVDAREARASPRARASRAQPAAAAVEHAVIVVSDGGGSDSDFVAEVPTRRRPSFGGARGAATARADAAPSTTHAACPVCSWCAHC